MSINYDRSIEDKYRKTLEAALAARQNAVERGVTTNNAGPVSVGPITFSERKAEGVVHVHASFTVKTRIFI